MPVELTRARLRQLIKYEPKTGRLIWRRRPGNPNFNGRFAGKNAGALAKPKGNNVYIQVMVDGQNYRAHRLAFLYVTGAFPEYGVDHKDGDGTNNKWVNLRPATNSQNGANRGRNSNNTSGYKRVSFDKEKNRYQVHIQVNGKQKFLGYFDDPAVGHRTYLKAARKYFGEFARTE